MILEYDFGYKDTRNIIIQVEKPILVRFQFFKFSLLRMASNSQVAKVGKSAKFITVQKWETELNCKLEYDIINVKVEKLVCTTCKKWEKRINDRSNF